MGEQAAGQALGAPEVPLPRAEATPSGASGEVIYRSERTVVRRVVTADGRRAVVKQPLGHLAARRLAHERSVLARVRHVQGVPRPLSGDAGDELRMEDLGGRRASELVADGPADPVELVSFGLQISDVLAAVHLAGVIHRDINPDNVLVEAEGPWPGADAPQGALVDFDLATTFAQVRPDFVDPRDIPGRLAYLAPEQTGRTGLPIDARTDLYALGATLYAMATGVAPFDDADPLEAVAGILARQPVPAHELRPGLPLPLSRIISRLLEKEPDDRYQSAAGLAHDLRAVRRRLDARPSGTGTADELVLGSRDFPAMLSAPTRLVGRDAEVGALAEALDRACRPGPAQTEVLVVSGPPGVGKSALVGQLRPLVAARGGWLVTGKADQFHQELSAGVLAQAAGGLCQRVLALPDLDVAAVRARALEALGANAGLMAGVIPGLEAVLQVPVETPGAEDPVVAATRMTRAVPDAVRGLVTPARPVVVFLDDVQWAGARGLATLDALVAGPAIAGLVVVAAYRDSEVDAAHPLTPLMERWATSPRPPRRVDLQNLRDGVVGQLVAEMLRLPVDRADDLNAWVADRSAGNPYQSVEVVNALRRDGALAMGDRGWVWHADRAADQAGDPDELIAARLRRLPGAGSQLLQAMSCVGAQVSVATLAAATGGSTDSVLRDLLPALEDGLVTCPDTTGSGGLSADSPLVFRHDLVQQAARDSMDEATRVATTLQLARRFVADGRPLEAAPLYLDVWERVTEPVEQGRVVALFQAAALAAGRAANASVAERYSSTGLRLHAAAGGDPAAEAAVALMTSRHAALYQLGRLGETDEVFARLSGVLPDPAQLAGPTCIQISSLTNRAEFGRALDLGLELLDRLGHRHPRAGAVAGELPPGVPAGYDAVESWVADADAAADTARPEVTDPAVLAAAGLLAAMCPPAFFTDQGLLGWIVCSGRRLWVEHGPTAALVAAVGHPNSWALGLRPDRRLDRRVTRHVMTVGAARGYDLSTARTQFVDAVALALAFDPLERIITDTRASRDVLLTQGDLQTACFTYYVTSCAHLDSAGSLQTVASDVDAGAALAERLGMLGVLGWSLAVRWLVEELRGGPDADADPEAGELLQRVQEVGAVDPSVAAYLAHLRAVRALLFGRDEEVTEHVAGLRPLPPALAANYAGAVTDLLVGLDAAARYRGGTGGQDALRELGECHARLAAAALHAPANYRHLAVLLAAEQARAAGEPIAALRLYDRAVEAVQHAQRPWHAILTLERAAHLNAENGLLNNARRLLTEAYRRCLDWGATLKAQDLRDRFPELLDLPSLFPAAAQGTHASPRQGSSLGISAHDLDLVAVLRASQEISSQTDVGRLNQVLAGQLRTLAGAVGVHVLHVDGNDRWVLQPDGGPGGAEAPGPAVPVDVTAGDLPDVVQRAAPLSVFRYLRHVPQPLVIADAVTDDRFADDSFFAGRERCSVLAVPILGGGVLRAVLILTNPHAGGTFGAARLEAVQMIAGQLAVSLDNARMYASLEEEVRSRTAQLEDATRELEALSLTDALTGAGNRRRFDTALADRWASAEGWPMTVVMIDIDHFKAFNDRNGHPAGDACISSVVRALSQGLREQDLLCRYGGEEFAVIIPRLPPDASAAVCERLRRQVAELAIAHPDGGVVSVSIGVAAQVPDPDGDPYDLVAAADAALYRAKRGGRNRVEAARPDGAEVG